jgi:hypothetical protein
MHRPEYIHVHDDARDANKGGGAPVGIKIGILRFKTVVSRACEVNTGTLTITRSFLCVNAEKKEH